MSEKAIIEEIKSYLKEKNLNIEKATTTSYPSPFTEKVQESNRKKIRLIEKHFRAILEILGLDLENDSVAKSPIRISKMFVDELFSGMTPEAFPKLTFINADSITNTDSPIFTKNISVNSICEHHFLPMIGKAHIAYMPNQKIIGLSKLNRIVHYFARRPQLQERLTMQIADCLSYVLGTNDVAVYLDLQHYCVKLRGVEDISNTITSAYLGSFKKDFSFQESFERKFSR